MCVVFQSVLGAEGLSLAFRHIVSSLLWYCSQHSADELLHELIISVGYFTVNHPDNQVSLYRPSLLAACGVLSVELGGSWGSLTTQKRKGVGSL